MLQLSPPRTWGIVTYPRARPLGRARWTIGNGCGLSTVTRAIGATIVGSRRRPVRFCCVAQTRPTFLNGTPRTARATFSPFSIHAVPEDWPEPDAWPVVQLLRADDILRPLLRHLLNWAGRGDAELTRLTLAQMLTCWVRAEIDAAPLPRDDWPEAVALSCKYLQQCLDADSAVTISLDDLARAAFVSPEHLCRLFQSATGRSPMQTVRLARLDRALALLSRSNYSVAQIAQLNGFASPFHFSRRFKDAFGCSPQQLRAQLQKGGTLPTSRLLQVLARGENIKNGHNLVKGETIENAREA